MKSSILAVIVGVILVGCGGAETQSLGKGQPSTELKGAVTCDTGDGWWNGPNPIPSNLNVPPGATCRLGGVEVQGNMNVQGSLYTIGSKFDGNVSVNGGCLTTANWGNTFKGNLSITNSPGCWLGGAVQDGFWTPYSDTIICGNFSYSYDLTYSGPKYGFYIQNCDGGTNCHNVIYTGNFTVSNASQDGDALMKASAAPSACLN